MYGTLAQFTADNLGMNQILGFIESFSCDFCCLLCYATRAEMQTKFREVEFTLRTHDAYERDLFDLARVEPTNAIHFRGVKTRCVLNDLQHFNVTENWINDAMHTLLEGVVPTTMGAVIFSISQKCGKVTVDSLNHQILKIFGILVVDKPNKPYLLFKLLEPGSEMTPKQGAAQQWALFRYMPLILCHLIDEQMIVHLQLEEHWELLNLLQEIVDLSFASALTESLLFYMANLIENFLKLFKRLYPHLSIRPKYHFMLHFPSIIRKNGPMRLYWCMNYERQNGTVKLPSHIVKNYRDIYQTLAYRFQCASFSNVLKQRFNRDFVLVKITEEMLLFDLKHAENFEQLLSDDVDESSLVEVGDKVDINGSEYRVGYFVAVAYGNYGYVFGKITLIVFADANTPFLLVTLYSTVEFDSYRYCYVIKKDVPHRERIVKIDDLLDYHPLDMVQIDGKHLIRLKYYILSK